MVIGHSGSLNCPKYPPAGQVAVKFLTVKYDFKSFMRPLLYAQRIEKPVFWFCDQVKLNSAGSSTEAS